MNNSLERLNGVLSEFELTTADKIGGFLEDFVEAVIPPEGGDSVSNATQEEGGVTVTADSRFIKVTSWTRSLGDGLRAEGLEFKSITIGRVDDLKFFITVNL